MGHTGWSIGVEAAENYEEILVPALFERWVPTMLRSAKVSAGDSVLDVACGTGVVARGALSRVGVDGRVVGLDAADAMLVVAERIEPGVEWLAGDAGDLPFSDGSFDAVICQSGLMFFPGQVVSIVEMWRTLKSGGRLAVQVWVTCEAQDAFASVIEEHAGQAIAEQYRTPWNLADPAELLALFRAAGIAEVDCQTEPGTARYSSVGAFLSGATGILVGADLNTQRLELDTTLALSEYITGSGALEFNEPGHVVTATKA
jgi:ubiquinone/menaquinone biosynthesis C-methylase UbiE